MPDTAHLGAAPDPGPVDLRPLDGMLAHLRMAERAVAEVAASLAEARDRLAAAPDDVEARHRVKMATLRMRGEATALAELFAALAKPEWAAP